MFTCGKQSVIYLVIFTLLFSIPALAATPPDSGTAMDAVKQRETKPPTNPAPEINVSEKKPSEKPKDDQKIKVNGFRIDGESIVPEQQLLALIQDNAGKELSLSDLNSLAEKITSYLRSEGYIVAFAYIPPQRIDGGIVTITVVLGKFGETLINNDAQISTTRLQKMLFAIKPGDIITKAALERTLLLINDLTGVTVKATLKPGQVPGTADLVLDVKDTSRINGVVDYNNWGNRFTGQNMGGAQITVNNFNQLGDSLTLGIVYTGDGLDNVKGQYSTMIAPNGMQLDLTYSNMSYTLGEDFELLDAVGKAEDIGGSIKYPFIRSRLYNLYGSFGYEFKRLHDDMHAINQSDPRTSRLWNMGITGNAADGWMGGGMNDYSIVYYNGHLNIDNAMNAVFDSATAKKAGNFQKVVVNYTRQQYITDKTVLNTRFEAQVADKNLDSSEKFSLGGANGLRAYPQGEASGDEGYRLAAELQYRLFSIEKNNFYMANFIDYGHVVINKDAWTSAGDESRNLSDVGIGFTWSRTDGFMFRCDYAWKIGPEKAVSDTDHSGHLWVRCVKYF